jgi:hypothetical protein
MAIAKALGANCLIVQSDKSGKDRGGKCLGIAGTNFTLCTSQLISAANIDPEISATSKLGTFGYIFLIRNAIINVSNQINNE